ncbi:hypothetical protein C1632_02545 [Microbacterium testaceum]|uniref:hypothetical protein n=1 Tax=Microbacterium testaceum TaxID=2033 RepID=UPI000CCFAA68|nr:hypothetical protein [Microbacterium testaceum]PNW10658.1 hypothetical protein C1632_02545 [Microbacterium testaceum]
MTTAADILTALRAAHSDAAFVPEVEIRDNLWEERDGASRPTRRIDALMFKTLQRTAIEIKVTLADWKRDTYAKRAPWENVTHRFVYVIPQELHDKVGGMYGTHNLNIYGCGVWVVSESGRVSVVRKAVVRPHPEALPQHVVQTLAFRAAGQKRPLHTDREALA